MNAFTGAFEGELPILEARARSATNLAELCFAIANDAYALLPFRQALVFVGASEAAQLKCVSGLAKLTEDSPYLVWIKRMWPKLESAFAGAPGWRVQADFAGLGAELVDGWQEWWPNGVYALPLKRRDGQVLGWALYLLDLPPTETQHQAMWRVSQSWSYCWEMLAGTPRRSLRQRWQGVSRPRRYALLGAVLLLPLLPIRQSLMAPAEVISLDSKVVSAPMEGVVKTLHVRPNQPVKSGDLLFSLDDTVLRNRLAVLRQSVAVADAELIASTQQAFDDPRSKSDLNMLTGRARERRAELAAVQEQLARIDVRAENDGVAVFADPDDWLGRPVTTGERIMQLADPDKPGVLIHVPVADATTLHEGAPVKLFLTVSPLSPLQAQVVQSSYQALPSPEGVASYRLRAHFDQPDEQARIGLRGSAKVYGGWTVLGYYLLRRPLASLRELTGW